MATGLGPEPPDVLHSGDAVAGEAIDDAGHGEPTTCEEGPEQADRADLSLKRKALAVTGLWKAEFATSREAMDLHLKSLSAIKPNQRSLSLM
eukprot:2032963-Heterocapsa_arctica.AAC.1